MATIVAHLKFRQHMARKGHVTVFPALWYPVENYVALLYNGFIIYIMYSMLDMRSVVHAIPVWILCIYA